MIPKYLNKVVVVCGVLAFGVGCATTKKHVAKKKKHHDDAASGEDAYGLYKAGTLNTRLLAAGQRIRFAESMGDELPLVEDSAAVGMIAALDDSAPAAGEQQAATGASSAPVSQQGTPASPAPAQAQPANSPLSSVPAPAPQAAAAGQAPPVQATAPTMN